MIPLGLYRTEKVSFSSLDDDINKSSRRKNNKSFNKEIEDRKEYINGSKVEVISV